MKNRLSDLNNHLFAQMERLSSENITEKKLEKEIKRTKAITSVAKEIVSNARLLLDAQIAVADRMVPQLPSMLEGGKPKTKVITE